MTESNQRTVTLAELKPADDNLRNTYTDLDSLSASIVENGLLQPLTVTTNGDTQFKIVAGHRRYYAIESAVEAGKLTADFPIPVYIREDLQDATRIQAMIVENVQRQDLNPIEEANGFRRLAEEFGMSQYDIAEKVGCNQSHVSKRLALLNLDEQAQRAVARGDLVAETAVLLSKLSHEDAQQLVDVFGWDVPESKVQFAISQEGMKVKLQKLTDQAVKAELPVIPRSELDSGFVRSDEEFKNVKEATAFFKSKEFVEGSFFVVTLSANVPMIQLWVEKGSKPTTGKASPGDVYAKAERLRGRYIKQAVTAVSGKFNKSRVQEALSRAFFDYGLTYSIAPQVSAILDLEIEPVEQANPSTGEIRKVRDHLGGVRAYAAVNDKQFWQALGALIVAQYGPGTHSPGHPAVVTMLEELGVPSWDDLKAQADQDAKG